MKFAAAIFALELVFMGTATCRADLLRRFQEEYPAASDNLEIRYSRVRMVTIEKTTDGQGKFAMSRRCEYLRDGNQYRKFYTVLECGRPDMPPGYVGAAGGNRQHFFTIGKRAEDREFALADFGEKSEGDFLERERLSCPPLVASYTADTTRVRDYLGLSHIRLVSADERPLDGRRVIEVIAEDTTIQSPQGRVHLYFVPNSWAFAGWTYPVVGRNAGNTHQVLELRISYTNDDPFQIRAIERWWWSTAAPNLKTDQEDIVVESIQFGPVPPREFTLAAFGVQEPGAVTGTGQWKWLLWLINGAICAAVGTWFAVLAHKRGRRKRACLSD